MEKILLSTYIVKIKKNKEDLMMSLFNGQEDLLDVFNDFFKQLFTILHKNVDVNSSLISHLSVDELPTIDKKGRCIYGFISSGIGGDDYNIKDVETNQQVFKVKPNHAAFRDVFFYLYLPKNKTYGGLVLQRKAKFGIKTAFSKGINKYIRELGYSGYFIDINSIIHAKVYNKMIKEGNVKSIDFIKHTIPSCIETFYSSGGKVDTTKGVLKTSISGGNLPTQYKFFIDKLFNRSNRQKIELKDLNEDFEEVEFELELNGKRKKFYVVERNRTQPDVDVSSEVVWGLDNKPTVESLLVLSKELVEESIFV